MKLLIPVLFALVAFVFFIGILYISKYKRRESGCCGGAALVDEVSGKSCDKNENRYCICKDTQEADEEV